MLVTFFTKSAHVSGNKISFITQQIFFSNNNILIITRQPQKDLINKLRSGKLHHKLTILCQFNRVDVTS